MRMSAPVRSKRNKLVCYRHALPKSASGSHWPGTWVSRVTLESGELEMASPTLRRRWRCGLGRLRAPPCRVGARLDVRKSGRGKGDAGRPEVSDRRSPLPGFSRVARGGVPCRSRSVQKRLISAEFSDARQSLRLTSMPTHQHRVDEAPEHCGRIDREGTRRCRRGRRTSRSPRRWGGPCRPHGARIHSRPEPELSGRARTSSWDTEGPTAPFYRPVPRWTSTESEAPEVRPDIPFAHLRLCPARLP